LYRCRNLLLSIKKFANQQRDALKISDLRGAIPLVEVTRQKNSDSTSLEII
jgi:hypothetical protein